MTRYLIVDQFSLLSPRWLEQHPCAFDALVEIAEAQPLPATYIRPRVATAVDEPEWRTTIFRERADGMAEFWRCKWEG